MNKLPVPSSTVWISQVPFRLAEVWWDRRYDQTDSGYIETLFANWFELGAEFLFICFFPPHKFSQRA